MNRDTRWTLAATGLAGATIALTLARRATYSFHDKAVFITGASRGLGLLMARLLAEEGARLTLVSRNPDSVRAVEKELSHFGRRVMTLACDVRDRQQVQNSIAASVRRWGSIDVLINNAGVIQVGPLEEMKIEDFELMMATHAWGPLYTTLAAVPHMRRKGGGRIVNISSIGGKIAVPHLVPYSMSKFALAGLSDGTRAELRKYGILVTSVYPGLMRTGSHVFAETKGNREGEFAWFSFMATNPLFAINPRRAARQIIEACRVGRPELVITTQANVAAVAPALAPGIVARISALVNRFLPQSPQETRAA
jgi:NAD(P)-dependent dehydrogenase (short-subunit alcohol dehydrogenase family)